MTFLAFDLFDGIVFFEAVNDDHHGHRVTYMTFTFVKHHGTAIVEVSSGPPRT